MSILKGILLTLVCFSLVACANLGSSGSQSSMKRASLYDPKPVKVETGIASWYNDRRTASGERFDKKALAAAHKKLPFGSKVRVVDLKTNKSIIVRINDRGPYKRGRVIDLTSGAAQQLGIYNRGIAKVRVEVLREIPILEKPNLRKENAAYRRAEYAEGPSFAPSDPMH